MFNRIAEFFMVCVIVGLGVGLMISIAVGVFVGICKLVTL